MILNRSYGVNVYIDKGRNLEGLKTEIRAMNEKLKIDKNEMAKIREIKKAERKSCIESYVAELERSGKKGLELLRFFKNIPSTYKYNWILARRGKLSKTKAVKLHCIECSGWSLREASECVVNTCALYNHRPRSRNED